MSQPTAKRPPQVTMAAGVIMFSSVLVLMTAWESLSRIRSLATRTAVEDLLTDPPASGMGLSVEGVLDVLYVAGVVAALCATATAILGWYVTKPDIPARRALTVVAVPLFFTGLVAGGFAASFVAAGTAMLWMQPGRQWFATGMWTPPSPAPSSSTSSTSTSTARLFRSGASTRPATPLVDPTAAPTPTLPVSGSESRSVPLRDHAAYVRPTEVVAAFVLTVAMAGAILVASLVAMVLAALSPELIMKGIELQWPAAIKGGTTLTQLQSATYALGTAIVVWAGVALFFSALVMAGRAWARRGLMVTAAFSAVVTLLLAFSAPVLVIPAAAALGTVWLLTRTEVRHWFAAQPR